MIAPYPASQILLALGFEPFSVPPRRPQLVQAIPKPRKAPGAPGAGDPQERCLLLPGTWPWAAVCHKHVIPPLWQLPPNFVTAAVSQDTATLPARKGTFYPAETGRQFKWGNVITHA